MRTYYYFRNPFLQPKISYFNQRESARHTLNMLQSEQADPELEGIYSKLVTPVQVFESHFTSRTDGKDVSLGATQYFNNKMTELRTNARKWEQKIVLLYDVDTPEYKAFFSSGRSSLYSGKIADRLDKINGLRNKLSAYPALAPVATEVGTFYQALLDLQTTKLGQFNDNTGASLELQAANINLAVAMYATLGKLIAKYAENPSRIEHFFLMSVLRSKPHEEEEDNVYGLLVPVLGSAVAHISFAAGDRFEVAGIGEGTVYCYGAVLPTDPPPASLIEIASGAVVEVTAEKLGAPDAKYFIFINKNEKLEGEVEIMLI